MGLFKQEQSLSELQERDERLETEVSIAKQEAMIRELKRRGQDWKQFSDNGKKSGINMGRVWQWFKSH